MKTYLHKEARRHGSSLQITNKKIEHDMAKFFKDKTICDLNNESISMTAKDEQSPKTRGKKDGGTQPAVRA